eukprot:scaffold2264_cov114-Isochrysis_galbana.AAC.14
MSCRGETVGTCERGTPFWMVSYGNCLKMLQIITAKSYELIAPSPRCLPSHSLTPPNKLDAEAFEAPLVDAQGTDQAIRPVGLQRQRRSGRHVEACEVAVGAGEELIGARGDGVCVQQLHHRPLSGQVAIAAKLVGDLASVRRYVDPHEVEHAVSRRARRGTRRRRGG